MKIFASLTLILLIIYTLFHLVPTKEKRVYTDDELRQSALSRDMSSIPNKYEDLLRLVDTPQNRLSKNKISLGKDLYFNKILSKDKDMSCASCHMISKNKHDKNIFLNNLTSKSNINDCTICHLSDQSGTDRLETAVGFNQQQNPFHLNTLTILNSALAKYQTWSGEVGTVEEQVGLCIQDKYQMNLSAFEAEQRLKSNPTYVQKFNLVFDILNFENIQKAIAAYVRTLLTRGDYDRFLDGNNDAMSVQAKKGLANFINFGCKGCHTGVSVGGQSIQKFPLRNYTSIISVTNSFNEADKGREVGDFSFNIDMYHPFPFQNKGGFMGKNNQQLFRVPILRNVTKTSPYFHNGAVKSIREAVYLMAKHQLGMTLTDRQIDEIVEFLKSLEGDIVDYKVLQEAKL